MSQTTDRLMSEATRRGVTLVAWVSLLATVGAWLYGSSYAPSPKLDTDSYAEGPIGHRAWVELLSEVGFETARKRTRYQSSDVGPVVFLEPAGIQVELDGWTATFGEVMATRRATGAISVVVLPKWRLVQGEAALVPVGEVVELLHAATGTDSAELSRFAGEETVHEVHGAAGTFRIEAPRIQSVSAAGCDEVLVADVGAIAVRCETTFVISEPDLLHNFNVHRSDNAAASTTLARAAVGNDVLIDEVFHGYGRHRKLGTALGRFPTVLFVVHMLLLGTVVVFVGMRRFGPERRAPAAFERGPRRIIEIAATVLASGSSPSVLVVNYIRQLVRDTAELFGADGDEKPGRAAVRVDDVAERFGLERAAEHALQEAENLAEKSHRKALGRALLAAQRVWRLRRDLRRAVTGKK